MAERSGEGGEIDRLDRSTEMRAEPAGQKAKLDELQFRVKTGDDDGCEWI